ncbi:MAG: universal stress protein, partial [Bdellovibrionales bacterium]|nr:universal stress protein [Bdellovibrionales bacterium]
MIRSILVPIDGSQSSSSALRIAASMAGLTDARLIGLFVQDAQRFARIAPADALAASIGASPAVESPLPPKEMLEEEERVEAESQQLYQAFQDSCEQARVRGRFLCPRGEPEHEIIEAARMVDLVILGNRGKHSGAPHRSEGDTVFSVLHVVSRPVLVVPEEPEGLGRMVIAYDGSATSERALRAAAELATVAQFDEVHLITAHDDPAAGEELQRSAVHYLSSYDLDTVAVVRAGDPKQV